MNIHTDIEGLDELWTAVDFTVNRINREANKIIKESAEPVAEEIRRTVPRSSPTKHPEEGHASDDVRISNVRTTNGGLEKYADVGFKVTEWRMWFLEFGTVHIAPRHYVEHAGLSQRNAVLSIQKQRLRELLSRRGVI